MGDFLKAGLGGQVNQQVYDDFCAGPLRREGQPGYCPECGLHWHLVKKEPDYERHAPKWDSWPAEPPPHLVEHILVGTTITLTCVNEHTHSFYKYKEITSG